MKRKCDKQAIKRHKTRSLHGGRWRDHVTHVTCAPMSPVPPTHTRSSWKTCQQNGPGHALPRAQGVPNKVPRVSKHVRGVQGEGRGPRGGHAASVTRWGMMPIILFPVLAEHQGSSSRLRLFCCRSDSKNPSTKVRVTFFESERPLVVYSPEPGDVIVDILDGANMTCVSPSSHPAYIRQARWVRFRYVSFTATWQQRQQQRTTAQDQLTQLTSLVRAALASWPLQMSVSAFCWHSRANRVLGMTASQASHGGVLFYVVRLPKDGRYVTIIWQCAPPLSAVTGRFEGSHEWEIPVFSAWMIPNLWQRTWF